MSCGTRHAKDLLTIFNIRGKATSHGCFWCWGHYIHLRATASVQDRAPFKLLVGQSVWPPIATINLVQSPLGTMCKYIYVGTMGLLVQLSTKRVNVGRPFSIFFVFLLLMKFINNLYYIKLTPNVCSDRQAVCPSSPMSHRNLCSISIA